MSNKTGTSTTTSTTASTTTNTNTSSPSHNRMPKDELEIIIIVICVVAVVALVILTYALFKKFRYSKPFLRLMNLTRGRSSTTGSHHPLEPDDAEDFPPPRTERELFSIGDHDDIDMRHRGAAPDDGYFFDEIYEKSAFVDETTNSSIKELKIPKESDDVPDLFLRSSR